MNFESQVRYSNNLGLNIHPRARFSPRPYSESPPETPLSDNSSLVKSLSNRSAPKPFSKLLHLVPKIRDRILNGSTRKREEGAKIILEGKFSIWSIKKVLIHIVSVGVTVLVIVISFGNLYTGDELETKIAGDSDGRSFELLQFAAKVHEILIVMSLSSILTHHIRKRLLGSKGVPLGLVCSGYQPASAEYLLSKSLWSAVRANGILTFCIAASIVFANTVGPSSAILMIPNLNWWNLAKPFDGKPTILLNARNADIFPAAFDADITNIGRCDSVKRSGECTYAGFNAIHSWASLWSDSNVNFAVTMPEVHTKVSRNIGNVWSDGPAVVAVTPSNSVIEMYGQLFEYYLAVGDSKRKAERPRFISDRFSAERAPIVSVECAEFDFLSALNGSQEIGNLKENEFEFLNFSTSLESTEVAWVDKSQITNDTASIGAVIKVPVGREVGIVNETEGTITSHWEQGSAILTCTIDARWIASASTYDPLLSREVAFNLTDANSCFFQPGGFASQSCREETGLSDSISISPSWAFQLERPRNDPASAHNASMITTLLNLFVKRNPFFLEEKPGISFTIPDANDYLIPSIDTPKTALTVATVLSVLFVDFLATHATFAEPYILVDFGGPSNFFLSPMRRQEYLNGGFETLHAWMNGSITDFEQSLYPDIRNWLALPQPEVWRYGYGYGVTGRGWTMAFALAVLLGHALIVCVHLLRLAQLRWWRRYRSNESYASSAWGTVNEVLALALVSRRAHWVLNNVGGGTECWDTWKNVVRVRERGVDEVEMVVGEDVGEGPVQIGKKYR